MHHRRISGHQYLMARAAVDSDQHVPEPTAAPSKQLPTSTLIVAVVAVAVGVTLIAGLGYCTYRAWKRRKERAGRLAFVLDSNKRTRPEVFGKKNWDLDTVSVPDKVDVVDLERPERAIVVASSDGGSDYDSRFSAGWVPQIKSKYGTNILAPKPSLKKQQSQPTVMHYNASSLSGSDILSMSPPPSYFAANQGYAGASIGGVLSGVTDVDLDGGRGRAVDVKTIPVPPTPRQRARWEAPPPTPPAGTSKFRLDSSMPVPPPLLSPARNESFAADTASSAVPPPSLPQEQHATSPMSSHVRNGSDQSIISRPPSVSERVELPRLMSVVGTFTPTLDDELPVRIGDTVRMLEEYKDGWCLAQYVGKINAAKGVVPRFCLQERRSIVPTHKASNSSLSSSVSKGSYRR